MTTVETVEIRRSNYRREKESEYHEIISSVTKYIHIFINTIVGAEKSISFIIKLFPPRECIG